MFASCAASIAAKLSGCPVKLTLSREVDMQITGGRHAFLANYEASAVVKGVDKVKLRSLKVHLFSNGGSALDLSGPVMDRALFHVDGPYYWPSFHAHGSLCKTVQPPHTAFRGFGGPVRIKTIALSIHLQNILQESDSLFWFSVYSKGWQLVNTSWITSQTHVRSQETNCDS